MTRHRIAAAGLTLVLFVFGCTDGELVTGPREPGRRSSQSTMPLPSTIEDLLSLEVGPVAIAHRGMGANLGEDPGRPIENTLDAVRQGYETGASVVEVDLQVTADGEVVTWHDDFLADRTCINTLTREQLEERAPHIPSFQAVLQTARRYNARNPQRLTGLLTVDLKPASPLCDPADATEEAFVSSVVSIVRRMEATELIYFNSMSPVLLGLAAEQAPEIPRQLTVLFLQLLPAEQVEAALGLPVVPIEKTPDYGLSWAELGPIFRLPGYSSPQQAIQTAFATGARMISYDLLLLGFLEQSRPGSAAELVQATQALGLHVFAGDVNEAAQWAFGAALGVEALYANDVPLAVGLQPELQKVAEAEY
ncbi:MAG: glycerophosphodiester phosphodiesterase [Longimicrobiales bacterium]